MFQRILAAIDGSELSNQVFDATLNLAKHNQSRILILHVLSPFNDTYANPVFPLADGVYPRLQTGVIEARLNQWDALEKQGWEMLRSRAEQAKVAGIETELMQPLGDAGKTICTVAQDWRADLITIGRRGRVGLSELLLGSVSNYVLHYACCSVLTVQGTQHHSSEG